jgi:hypothetical protein
MSKPTFLQYLKSFHSYFKIDQYNDKEVKLINDYYCDRSKFESCTDQRFFFSEQKKLYGVKGLLIIGNIGTGKTTLLGLVKRYLSYIKDLRGFRSTTIPQIADLYTISGRQAFANYLNGNWFFDELCFLNPATGTPDGELAPYYGDKVLVGEKLIMDRYRVFMETGWQSLFTTNANLETLNAIYTERGYSRLLEMCNVIFYKGPNRRVNNEPHILLNKNDRSVQTMREPKVATPPKELSKHEMDKHLVDSFNLYKDKRSYIWVFPPEFEYLQKMGYAMPPIEKFFAGINAEMPQLEDELIENYAQRMSVAEYFEMLVQEKKDIISFLK